MNPQNLRPYKAGSKRTTRIPWDKLRREYFVTNITYEGLSAKYGVNVSTINKRAASEKWAEKKKEAEKQAMEIAVAKMSDNLLEHMRSVTLFTGSMMQELEKMAKQINGLKIASIQDFDTFTRAYQRLDDLRRRAMGANDDKKEDQDGMTPTNLARQEAMLQDLSIIRVLVAENKIPGLPDIEMMKKAIIVDDGS